jgi:pimeloyl-ACP methyl ester carboxylesterase
MTSFILIPGAGGMAWYWHRIVPFLEQAGHEAIAVDLPADDPALGLSDYANGVVAAIGKRKAVTLVAQSMGAFVAALVCARARAKIRRLVLVNAMIPLPGETAGEWWDHTSSEEARVAAAECGGYPVEFDLDTYFFHDVSKRVVADGAAYERDQTERAFSDPAAFDSWPDIPIHVVAGKDDRFFPRDFQARVARERLGKDIDEVPGGHLAALSHPKELATMLLSYEKEDTAPPL